MFQFFVFCTFASLIIEAATENPKRTILITGSTDGIGRITAKSLIQNPDNFVILHGRNESRCQNVTNWMKQQVGQDTDFACVTGEFLNMTDVDEMAKKVNEKFPGLNTLLLNAGIFPYAAENSTDRLEKTFQTNHLAHFVLAQKLKDTLVKNAPSRVVVTSSAVHRWFISRSSDKWDDYWSSEHDSSEAARPGIKIYSKSKLWNVMFADSLAEELEGKGVTVNSCHPGHWQTKLSRWTGKPVEDVRIVAYLAQDPAVEGKTKKYFLHCNPTCGVESRKNPLVTEANRKKLWSDSLSILKKVKGTAM